MGIPLYSFNSRRCRSPLTIRSARASKAQARTNSSGGSSGIEPATDLLAEEELVGEIEKGFPIFLVLCVPALAPVDALMFANAQPVKNFLSRSIDEFRNHSAGISGNTNPRLS